MSTTKPSLERIKQNAADTNNLIKELKDEINSLDKKYKALLVLQLQQENTQLSKAVDCAKKQLIQIEIKNGREQIPVPNDELQPNQIQAIKEDKIFTKEKKVIKPKQQNNQKSSEDLPVDIGRLDLRVGKVEDVQRHPDADSLYVLKINCGDEKPRTVCSGLVKHVPMDYLKNQYVLVLCNLKPVKMRGITSEAMVMCASSEKGVEVLSPPNGCIPGELVQCDGFLRQPDAVMNPKKKIFETVAEYLHTNENMQACYKSVPLSVPGKGNFNAKTLSNVPVK